MTAHQEQTNKEVKITPKLIEQALQHGVGDESKDLIIKCIQQKYGMDFELVGQYKTEFENYLRELLNESAEIIIARMKSMAQDAKLASAASAKKTVKRFSDNVHFLFCDQCYWSASLLTSTFKLRCGLCNTELKCALPIGANEEFRYELDDKRGLVLFFS